MPASPGAHGAATVRVRALHQQTMFAGVDIEEISNMSCTLDVLAVSEVKWRSRSCIQS